MSVSSICVFTIMSCCFPGSRVALSDLVPMALWQKALGCTERQYGYSKALTATRRTVYCSPSVRLGQLPLSTKRKERSGAVLTVFTRRQAPLSRQNCPAAPADALSHSISHYLRKVSASQVFSEGRKKKTSDDSG